MTAKQIGPLTGILFVVLVIAAFVVGGETPGTDDSPQTIVSFYLDNDSEQSIASALLALACVPFLFFLAALRRALRTAAGDEGGLSTVALLGGLMIVVGASIFAGIGFTLGDAADQLPASAVLTLNALNSDLFFPVFLGICVFYFSTALAILSTGALPRWWGWMTLVLAVISLLGPGGFIAFLALAPWTLVASILLMRGSASTEAPQALGAQQPVG